MNQILHQKKVSFPLLCGRPGHPMLWRQSIQLVDRLIKLLPFLSCFICSFPPWSLVLIRHVHIRGSGDAFMIIHPPSPPIVIAALDAHPLCTRHLALALFGLTVCITILFNGLFRGAGGAGGRGGQETFQEFPVDVDPARSHWEGPVLE